MSIAYITGGQYVPMVNAQLLAQVIIGGVREEITLERLMQDAHADIAREIEQATDDGDAARRVNRYFAERKTRTKQMRNKAGVISRAAEESYSKCTDMSELREKYRMTAAADNDDEDDADEEEARTYEVNEDDMSVEQAKRIVQKVKNRKKADE